MRKLFMKFMLLFLLCLSFIEKSLACDDVLTKQNKIESMLWEKDYSGINKVELSKADREQIKIECVDSVIEILKMKSLAHAKLNENSLAKDSTQDAIQTLALVENMLFDGHKKKFSLEIILQSIEFNLDYQHAIIYSNALLERMAKFIHEKSQEKKYPMLWQFKEMHAVASNIYAHNLIERNDCPHALKIIHDSEEILPQFEVQKFQVGLERDKLKKLCD